ncbi:CD1845 family protein [Actinomyces sp. zg-332]|uniref:CD1845 family protein n=1 Tax=Actinomyces sp. zg-332 TaxID=2708340 RepID=UPI001E45A8A1|nr:CD1845 family protein [Actinomyces sp. zg-332]
MYSCCNRLIYAKRYITWHCEALILGFLLSPYGIPMVGVVAIDFLQGINERIKPI